MRYKIFFTAFAYILISACYGQMKDRADRLVFNGKIYSCDKKFSVFEAFAVRGGKIIATGSSSEILQHYFSDTLTDLSGKTVFPGFIDAHCHFDGYALGLQQIDLTQTTSFDQVISKLMLFANDLPEEWIVGYGWDQNKWNTSSFPDKTRLDHQFPNRPVVLIRIDGHMVLANTKAIQRSGILDKKEFTSGEVVKKMVRLQEFFVKELQILCETVFLRQKRRPRSNC